MMLFCYVFLVSEFVLLMDFYVIRLISLSAVLGTVSGHLMCVCSHRERERESKFMNKCNFNFHRENWNIERNGSGDWMMDSEMNHIIYYSETVRRCHRFSCFRFTKWPSIWKICTLLMTGKPYCHSAHNFIS